MGGGVPSGRRSDLRGGCARPRRFRGCPQSKRQPVAGQNPAEAGCAGMEGVVMNAARKAEFEQAVKAAAGPWQPVQAGDPNTIDLRDHARKIEDGLRLHLPALTWSKQDGVAVVELVERHLVASTLMRNLPPGV